jgi:hypothetical protein
MRTFSEGKEAGTVTRHLHVILTRSRRKNHAGPYMVGPVGDVRREASVERCDECTSGKIPDIHGQKARPSRAHGRGVQWVDVP